MALNMEMQSTGRITFLALTSFAAIADLSIELSHLLDLFHIYLTHIRSPWWVLNLVRHYPTLCWGFCVFFSDEEACYSKGEQRERSKNEAQGGIIAEGTDDQTSSRRAQYGAQLEG